MNYGIIYRVTHRESGRVYIGQTTTTVPKRWACHVCRAKKGEGTSIYLARAIRKYGAKAFELAAIAHASNRSELDYLEQFFIITHNADVKELGFNMTEGGESRQKRNLTDEHRHKISIAHRGKKKSPSHRAAMRHRIYTAEGLRRIKLAAQKRETGRRNSFGRFF
jgi:group I intron endonuclease